MLRAPSTMLLLRLVLVALITATSSVAAQKYVPFNDTSSLNNSGLVVFTGDTNPSLAVRIEPFAKMSTNITIKGALYVDTPGQGVNIESGEIVFLSCDSSPDVALSRLSTQSPAAIIMFSYYSDHCALSNSTDSINGPSSPFFTSVGMNASVGFVASVNEVNANTYLMNGVIKQGMGNSTINPAAITANGGAGGNASIGNGQGSGGGVQTTQVAMIVLYSITGLITGLFLIIIVTGAFRAHRHPERYGPRAMGRFGAMRQSRARGVARAMLDSIPIVKFGGNETEQEKEPDVEMSSPAVLQGATEEKKKEKRRSRESGKEVEQEPETDAFTPAVVVTEPVEEQAREHVDEDAILEGESSKVGEAIQGGASSKAGEAAEAGKEKEKAAEEDDSSVVAPAAVPTTDDNGAMCSICTEEFVKGDDQRLLPCKHAYHPACVDPWLLSNGTCPLCRIDLLAGPDAAQYADSPMLITSDDHAAHNPRRLSRMYTDMRRLSHVQPDERIAALRRLRDETRGLVAGSGPRRRSALPTEEDVETSADEDRARRSNRLSGMLRRNRRGRSGLAAGDASSGGSSDDVSAPRVVAPVEAGDSIAQTNVPEHVEPTGTTEEAVEDHEDAVAGPAEASSSSQPAAGEASRTRRHRKKRRHARGQSYTE